MENSIYVDPDSSEPIELGTRKFPFKSLIWAIRTIFHNHDLLQNYEIYLNANSPHFINSKVEPIFIFETKNLTIMYLNYLSL